MGQFFTAQRTEPARKADDCVDVEFLARSRPEIGWFGPKSTGD